MFSLGKRRFPKLPRPKLDSDPEKVCQPRTTARTRGCSLVIPSSTVGQIRRFRIGVPCTIDLPPAINLLGPSHSRLSFVGGDQLASFFSRFFFADSGREEVDL